MTQPAPRFDEDSELVQAARNQNDGALQQLFLRHRAKVFRIAMAITRIEADAAEVTQETFLKVLEHLDQFRGEARFSTWLWRIAVNESRLKLRRHQTDRWELLDQTIQVEEDNPEQKYAREERKGILRQALDSLPQPYRLAIVLRDLDGFNTEEAAAALGLSVPAVKIRLLRARLMMRGKLAGSFQKHQNKDSPVTPSLNGLMRRGRNLLNQHKF